MHEVFVSEAVGFVWIRPLTARDWGEYLDQAEGTDEESAWLVARCTLDREGRRIFRDDDVERVNGLPASIVIPISNAILRESGIKDRDWRAERQAFRKGVNARFGQRLARDFGRSDVDTFLDGLTPGEYQRFRWSYELDPPLDELLRTGNALLAELLARYHNVNFHDRDSADPLLTGSDFLPNPDARDEDDTADAEEEAGDWLTAAAVHPMLLPGVAHVGPGLAPRGHGEQVPESVFALFGDGDDGEEE